MDDPPQMAIFGGTFDPVHAGHLHMAELAVAALSLDVVRWVPCRISPHKTGVRSAPAKDRLEMLRLATSGFSWSVVDDCEVVREGPSFSYQTAESMAVRFPKSRLFWIMGEDQWDALPRWTEPERLAAVVEFIVFARGGVVSARAGYRMHPVAGEHPASATAIRAAVAAGVVNHEWLNHDVAQWIARRGLYGDRASTGA